MRVLSRSCVVLLALAVIASADPVNGDFEQGSLNGWTQDGSGDAMIVDSGELAPLGPIGGSYSGFVHNGPDGAGSIGILTSSPFVSPDWGGVLSFSWDFLTAEFTGIDEWEFGGSGLDAFRIELYDILADSAEILVSGSVVDSSFELLSDVVTAPDGTSYFEHTGVDTFTRAFDAAGSYRLRFIVEDGPVYDPDLDEIFEDDWIDSGLLVDDVFFVANDPPPPPGVIPEPSTFALVALSGLAVVILRRRRR